MDYISPFNPSAAPINMAVESNMASPEETGGSGFGVRDAVSIGVGMAPVAGSVQSVVELVSGKDYITGEETSRAWAAAGIIAGIIPGGKGALKAAQTGLKGRKAADGVDAARRGVPENPSAYSVAFEMRLDPADFGKSRSVHFNRANAALDNALQSDARFLNMMDELIPGGQSSVSSVGGRATPNGWTWEHASTSTAFGEQGVMRLVPSNQHNPNSPFWRVLHPDAGAPGGYSEWAIPKGAPKN